MIIIKLHIIFVKIWTNSFCIYCVNSDPPTPIVASNSGHIQRNESLNMNLSIDILENASQFVESHGPKADVVQHNSRQFQNEIMASRQTFPNTDAFHDVVYLMPIGGRFQYYY